MNLTWQKCSGVTSFFKLSVQQDSNLLITQNSSTLSVLLRLSPIFDRAINLFSVVNHLNSSRKVFSGQFILLLRNCSAICSTSDFDSARSGYLCAQDLPG